jgi:putative sugar O-methyltransferase
VPETRTDYEVAFAELFGFVDSHPTFADAMAASENPTAFRRGGVDFWNFKARAGAAFADVSRFVEFQHDLLFHFCTSRDFSSDVEALAAARQRSPQWLDRLLAVGDSPVGYRPGTLLDGQCTLFHTRHCAWLTLLLHHLAPHHDPARLRIVEIGGGFGNFARLWGHAVGIHEWTIVDMPFMTGLQQWYLRKTLPQVAQHGDPGVTAGPRLRWIDTEHKNEFVDENPPIDVLVSTHAWSELPRDEWLWYLHNLLPRARCLLYAASNETPNPTEANWRLQRLAQVLRPIDLWKTHDDSTVVALYVPR